MRIQLAAIAVLACLAGCENNGRDLTESDPTPFESDRADPPRADIDRDDDGLADRVDPNPPAPPVPPANRPPAANPSANRDAGSDVTQQPTDRTFTEQAISGGMFEVQSAQMALDRKVDEDLQHIAQMILEDHRGANAELKAMALSRGVVPPTELQSKHQEMLEQLRDPKAVDFGATFRQVQISAHQDAIALFEEYITNGRDAQLRAFAEKTLPTLKSHLNHLQGTEP